VQKLLGKHLEVLLSPKVELRKGDEKVKRKNENYVIAMYY